MGDYTRFGCNLWHWEPFLELDDSARVLWIGLYTTSEAKRICPGMWHGSIGTMADAVHQPSDVVLKSLDNMIDRRLVEYDQRHRVLRMTQLPDTGECPYNASTILGWWNRYRTLPKCRVRDAHVVVMQGLFDAGMAAVNKQTMQAAMSAAWNESFGTIAIPAQEARYQRLIDSDTSTRTQPSLFPPPKALNLPSERNQEDLISEAGVVARVRPPAGTGTGRGEGTGTGFSFQGPDRQTAGPADQAQWPTPPSNKPKLELVPPPALAPFSVDDVLEALGVGVAQIRESVVVPSLWSAITECARAGWGMPDLELLGRYVRETAMPKRDCVDILTGDRLVTALSRARHWHDQTTAREERARALSAELQAARDLAGV